MNICGHVNAENKLAEMTANDNAKLRK